LKYDESDNSFELQDAGEMYEQGGQIEKETGLYITVKSYTKAHLLLDYIASPKLQIEVSGHDMKKHCYLKISLLTSPMRLQVQSPNPSILLVPQCVLPEEKSF
jgi:hypothetical protein